MAYEQHLGAPDFNEMIENIKSVPIDPLLSKLMKENIIPIDSLTPEQAREQKINFCLGMASRDRIMTRAEAEALVDNIY